MVDYGANMHAERKSLLTAFQGFIPPGLEPHQPLPDRSIQQASQWLARVIDAGNDLYGYRKLSEKHSIPHGEVPLIYLEELIRASGNRDVGIRLAEVAGEMLRPVLVKPETLFNAKPLVMARRSEIVDIFSFVPAQRDIPLCLYRAYKYHFEDNPNPPSYQNPYGDNLRRQMLLALAISNPKEIDPGEMMRFFINEMDNPAYAVAAFTGVKRMSPEAGIGQLPLLYAVLKRDGLPTHQPTWGLLRATEGQNKDRLYQKLGEILDTYPEFKADFRRVVLELLEPEENSQLRQII